MSLKLFTHKRPVNMKYKIFYELTLNLSDIFYLIVNIDFTYFVNVTHNFYY